MMEIKYYPIAFLLIILSNIVIQVMNVSAVSATFYSSFFVSFFSQLDDLFRSDFGPTIWRKLYVIIHNDLQFWL